MPVLMPSVSTLPVLGGATTVGVGGGIVAVGGTRVAVGGGEVGVGLGKTAVGAGLPLAWVGATVGCAFGTAVGVGAANVDVGTLASTAAARAADRIQARIRSTETVPVVRQSAGGWRRAISAPRQFRLAAQSQTIVVASSHLSQELARAQ